MISVAVSLVVSLIIIAGRMISLIILLIWAFHSSIAESLARITPRPVWPLLIAGLRCILFLAIYMLYILHMAHNNSLNKDILSTH